MGIVVLCTRKNSVYRNLPPGLVSAVGGVTCIGEEDDGGVLAFAKRPDTDGALTGVVAHPPCHVFSLARTGEAPAGSVIQAIEVGRACLELVEKHGGYLEQPEGSKLWRYLGLPAPGAASFTGLGRSYLVYQSWWGHRAPKPTWIYAFRRPPVPDADITLAPCTTVQNMGRAEREATPALFARALVAGAAQSARYLVYGVTTEPTEHWATGEVSPTEVSKAHVLALDLDSAARYARARAAVYGRAIVEDRHTKQKLEAVDSGLQLPLPLFGHGPKATETIEPVSGGALDRGQPPREAARGTRGLLTDDAVAYRCTKCAAPVPWGEWGFLPAAHACPK